MALSVIVAQFEGLSTFAAAMKRLGDLWDELDEYDIEGCSLVPGDDAARVEELPA